MTWKPGIEEGPSPLYERIADAIQDDIQNGILHVGARLPPHRDLAHRLSIGIGTVTKAYGEAERRGLLSSHVGRGSFVASVSHAKAADASGTLDLAYNFPPMAATSRVIAETMGRLWRRQDFRQSGRYTLPEGLESVRAAAWTWISQRHQINRGSAADLIQTNGGQHALSLLLHALRANGDAILCEAATFHGLKLIAKASGLTLHGVEMDSDGMIPEALEAMAASSKNRILYTIPTLQNPTTSTMPAARRERIADVARRHDLLIIEDDAYRAIAGHSSVLPPTFADLAPERTFYISSISKSISPGLRLAFIQPPSQSWRERILEIVVATGYAPPSQGAMIFAQWVEDGNVDSVLDDIVGEIRIRTALARRILAGAVIEPGAEQSLHVWLPLGPLKAEQVYGRALRAGVQVTPPDVPLVGSGSTGLRLCLGSISDRTTLERALSIVAKSLTEDVSRSSSAIV